jgi:hypothetical protein
VAAISLEASASLPCIDRSLSVANGGSWLPVEV